MPSKRTLGQLALHQGRQTRCNMATGSKVTLMPVFQPRQADELELVDHKIVEHAVPQVGRVVDVILVRDAIKAGLDQPGIGDAIAERLDRPAHELVGQLSKARPDLIGLFVGGRLASFVVPALALA